MGLLENLSEAPQPRRKSRCKMSLILENLTEAERGKVTEIMASLANLEGRYSSNWLARELNSAGHTINHQSVLRHARRECCCEL